MLSTTDVQNFISSLLTTDSNAIFSADGLRASAENIVAKLRGTHVVDVFEPARMSQSEFPLEDVMRTLKKLKEEGLFKHVGLSEVGAETIRKASKVS